MRRLYMFTQEHILKQTMFLIYYSDMVHRLGIISSRHLALYDAETNLTHTFGSKPIVSGILLTIHNW